MKNVAFITGASMGIGREFSRVHAEQGGDLIIVARRAEKLAALKTELEKKHGVKVMVITKDLSMPQAAQEVYDEVKNAGIEIDYLINNAGFGGIGKFYERKWADDHAMLMVNMMTLTHLTRLFLPEFVKRNHGRILNVSSAAALLPGPMQAVYYATKAYVTSFSNAVAEELYDTRVTVTTLMPGMVDTEFAAVSGMDKTAVGSHGYDAAQTAREGYHGMLAGKLNVYSGRFSQKVAMKLIPFTPIKVLLKSVRKMQAV